MKRAGGGLCPRVYCVAEGFAVEEWTRCVVYVGALVGVDRGELSVGKWWVGMVGRAWL